MEIRLTAKKANAFVREMERLGDKFDNKYVNGKISDLVKLDIVAGKLELRFSKPLPEMVKIACYSVFVDTLL